MYHKTFFSQLNKFNFTKKLLGGKKKDEYRKGINEIIDPNTIPKDKIRGKLIDYCSLDTLLGR